jgi:hypothetical protein
MAKALRQMISEAAFPSYGTAPQPCNGRMRFQHFSSEVRMVESNTRSQLCRFALLFDPFQTSFGRLN